MDYLGFLMAHSSPTPEDAPLLSSGSGTEAAPAPPFIPYNQNASYSSSPSLYDFYDHQPQPSGSSLAANLSPSITHPLASPVAVKYSTWSDATSDIGNTMSPPFYTSEFSMQLGRQVSAVVAKNDSTYNPPCEPERRNIRFIFPSQRISAPCHGQATATPSDPMHVTLWNLAWTEAVIINGPREFVPQIIYQPGYEGDKKRYVSLAKLYPPIIFVVEGSSEWGIPVPVLLSRGLVRVAGGNEPAFTVCGPSIGIRVQWPGYPPCHKQVSTKDYTSKRCMIKKARLAKVVARCVSKFMGTMSTQEMQAGSDRKWKVGRFGITVDDIILVSLHHVSQGSWQPQLRLRRIVETNMTPAARGHVGDEIVGETSSGCEETENFLGRERKFIVRP